MERLRNLEVTFEELNKTLTNSIQALASGVTASVLSDASIVSGAQESFVSGSPSLLEESDFPNAPGSKLQIIIEAKDHNYNNRY